MFFAEKNSGAFFNNQRIRVSKKNNLDECLFGTNRRGINKTDLNCRISGSAALDLAYVGAGRLDGFFQNNLNLWDIAAGILIVKEAGGKVNNIDLNKTGNIDLIATSNNINDQIYNKLSNF